MSVEPYRDRAPLATVTGPLTDADRALLTDKERDAWTRVLVGPILYALPVPLLVVLVGLPLVFVSLELGETVGELLGVGAALLFLYFASRMYLEGRLGPYLRLRRDLRAGVSLADDVVPRLTKRGAWCVDVGGQTITVPSELVAKPGRYTVRVAPASSTVLEVVFIEPAADDLHSMLLRQRVALDAVLGLDAHTRESNARGELTRDQRLELLADSAPWAMVGAFSAACTFGIVYEAWGRALMIGAAVPLLLAALFSYVAGGLILDAITGRGARVEGALAKLVRYRSHGTRGYFLSVGDVTVEAPDGTHDALAVSEVPYLMLYTPRSQRLLDVIPLV